MLVLKRQGGTREGAPPRNSQPLSGGLAPRTSTGSPFRESCLQHGSCDDLIVSEPGSFKIPQGDGRLYEAYVVGTLQRLIPGSLIRHNVKLPGLKSGRDRQIDILLERKVGDFTLRIVFDCKHYNRKVNVNHVESFLGMLDDVRVSKGVLVTSKGYSKTAYKRTQREPRDIELRILPPDRLSEFQGLGFAWPWKAAGSIVVSAMVPPPPGWVVDNQDTGKPGEPQFIMYPLGHSRESAKRYSPLIYGVISLKSSDHPTMETIALEH
jgi:hypothetical protein